MGVLPDSRRTAGQDRPADAVVEAPGVVVDEASSGLAVLYRASVGALRLQRGAVFSELCGGPGRSLVRPCASASVWRQRPSPMAGSLPFTHSERDEWGSRRL